MTEIKGSYDLKLSWMSRALIDQGGLTMFDAVEKQLGLKLEPAKDNVAVVVVDHMEQLPTDN